MKIAVVSDTHGSEINILEFINKIGRIDMIIHLGDCVDDVRFIRRHYNGKIISVRGNCEDIAREPLVINEVIENIRFIICHGHSFGVKKSIMGYLYKALENEAKIALFGHTHIEAIEDIEGVLLINPGSLSRSLGKGNSYCVIEIDGSEIHSNIVYL